MESTNVVFDDYNDFTGVSKEDEIISLIKEVRNQMQNENENVTCDVATQLVSDIATTSATIPEVTYSETDSENDIFDITGPIIRDPSTKIKKNHPIENIICEPTKSRKIRERGLD